MNLKIIRQVFLRYFWLPTKTRTTMYIKYLIIFSQTCKKLKLNLMFFSHCNSYLRISCRQSKNMA